MLPLERLLRLAEGAAPADLQAPEGHFVYLRDNPPIPGYIKVPMPEIPNGSDTQRGEND